MSSKNGILNDIEITTKRRQHVKKEVEPVSLNINNDGDIIENCITNMTNNKSQVITCQKKDIFKNIQNILKEAEAENLLYFDNLHLDVSKFEGVNLISYDKSVNEMQEILFKCDTSIVQAKLAVSNLGVFCITSDEQPRLMSLLPKNCIVLLKKEDIVDSMNEANKILKSSGRLPTNIVYISGPSRTADIELQIVLGVHGPQNVYGIIY